MNQHRINTRPTRANVLHDGQRIDAVKWLCVRIQYGSALLCVAMRCLLLCIAIGIGVCVVLIRTLACIDGIRAWRERRQCCMEFGYRKTSARCLRCEGMHHRPRLVLLTFCRD